ncbi:FAD-dependent oxidoreductase [Limnochorda pilosa]|uniref:FAD-dependent pyridine nucleotide-disulfide oxidoreductase n=1 Tax=Limnochorda pilosa TaxID=1555112 RepID=A0A0K2SGW9_LIMPI|nr:FAD-dependent oxidoreductase [Limnochorda pilosa]BAS26361.1 FAD-dependent pyridine nucleotide-disulfide oxidoreductase [Limnochorda pilosa]
MQFDVAVVGGGAAGGSAAIFLAKAELKTLVLDNDKGQTRRAWIENHYGLAGGVSGPDLVDAGQRQAQRLGAEWEIGQVVEITREDGGFALKIEDGRRFEAKQVLLATGAAMSLAEALNLEFTDGRETRYPRVVKVDLDGRTSEPGIWAAGILAGASAHTIITAGHGAQVAVGLISETQGKRHVQHDALK